jgi:hypothetical protein
MLMSACRNIQNKIVIKHDKDRNGILAWMELRRDYDNDGNKNLRMEILEDIIHKPFQNNQHGGLAAYIDQFLGVMNEMEILQQDNYPETHKKRLLMMNVRGVSGIAHLAQKCRDDYSMSFDQMATYLRTNSKTVESEPHSKKRAMNVIGEDAEYLTWEETLEKFEEVSRASNKFQAYQAFNNTSIRQGFHIHEESGKNLVQPFKQE